MKPERVDATLDARGMLCPMPIVKSNKAIDPLQHGQVLEVLATDKGSCVDVPAWCSARRHTLLHTDTDGQVYRFYIKKGN